jgi:hypothetical protein
MTLISTFSNNIRDRLIVTRNGFADIARLADMGVPAAAGPLAFVISTFITGMRRRPLMR